MESAKQETLHILNTVAEALSTATDAQSISNALFTIVDNFIDVPYSSIFLWDFEQNRLRLFANKGFSEEDKKYSEETAMDRHPGWVFINRQPLHIRDMESEIVPVYVKSGKRAFEVRSRLWMPITTIEKSLGAFGFASTEKDFFNDEHKNVLALVCRLAGNIYSNVLFSASEKEYAKNLQLSLEQLREAGNAQQNFIAKMSHEMRTPLNGILGMTELLNETSPNENQIKLLKIIDSQANILLGLINQVLDVSKIQAEEIKLMRFPLHLRETLETAIQTHRIPASAKKNHLQLFISPEVPAYILGDTMRLTQIINNLISNANKFTDEGEIWIRVSSSEQDDIKRLTIEVADTGIGFDSENGPDVFAWFVQSDNALGRVQGGMGLGLFITKEIVQKMGGEITVKSKPGYGSTFQIQLPLESTEAPNAPIDIIKEKALSGKRVLIAEDNEINQFYLKSLLEKNGTITTCVEDGVQAVQVCRHENFDLILMDIQMPNMNGIDAAKTIRNELKLTTPIIAQTANTIIKDIGACYAAGMNDFITKPFTEAQLLSKISIALKKNISSPAPDTHNNSTSMTDSRTLKERALEACAGSEKIALGVVDAFLRETPKTLQIMDKSVESKDQRQLNLSGHKLKGSMRLLKYEEEATLCYELEKFSTESSSWEVASAKMKELTLRFNAISANS